MVHKFGSLRASAAAAALVLAIGAGVPAHAGVSTLSGNMALPTWSVSNTGGNGFANYTPGGDVSLTSSDGSTSGRTDFYHTIGGAGGTLSFDWAYQSYDIDQASTLDPASYFINGARTYLMNDTNSSGSGSVSLDLAGGDVFGWSIASSDGCCGPAVLSVSNIGYSGASGPVAPAPLAGTGMLATLAAAIALLVTRGGTFLRNLPGLRKFGAV